MLLLHEVHTVSGRHEDAFEEAFRAGWMKAVADDPDVRLLYYLKLAHGTGRAYHHTSITGLQDGDAYERLARRVQSGDLRAWAAEVDGMRHEVKGKILLPVDWSPMRDIDLASVPTDGRTHEPALYMEDSAWPYEARLDDYLVAARTHYAPSLVESARGGRAILELLAAFQTAWGTGRRSEVVLWQRILENARLQRLLETEVPPAFRGPGSWMHDALAVRDDWESRLLRTTRWSPLT